MQPTASTTRLKIDFAQATDPGRDPNKQINEDSCGYAETKFGHLAVLCDGMGGHYGGREASRTAITTIFEVMEQAPATMTPANALKMSIEEAARRVYRLGGPAENRTRPGSTVVAMLLHDGGVDVAHVGDSRAYVIRSNQIYPLTRDHSMVQGMIDAGMLTEEQAIGHPDANKITRALGMRPEVDVEVRPEPMELFPGDVLLQSSDGLTDLALGQDILGATRQALSSGGVSHAANMLVKLANDRGGHDNITVQMIRIQETGGRKKTQAPTTMAGSSNGPPMTTLPQTAAQPAYGAPAPTDSGSGYGGPASAMPASLARPNGPPQGAWGPPKETVQMTSPEAANPHYAHGMTPQPPSALAHSPIVGGWGQVQPTVDGGRTPAPPTASGAAPGPTVADGSDPNQPWSSAMYTGPTPQGPPQGPLLQQYRMDPAQTPLPLPPARYPPPNPTAPSAQIPLPPSIPGDPRPSRGGIVFLIIGLSSVIAILAIFIIWALFLR